MPFRWNDTSERMMLIKFLEQNMSAKLDVTAALASWPADLELPTVRSLGDRFRAVKQHLTKQHEDYTSAGDGGQASTQTVPPTPNHKRPSVGAGPASKKQKTTANGAVSSIKSNFATTKVNSTTTKARSNAKAQKKGKGKRGDSDDELSMSDHASNSDADADDEAAKDQGAVTIKRELPTRGSKSVTPGFYDVDRNDESGTEIGENDGHAANSGRVNGSNGAGHDEETPVVKVEPNASDNEEGNANDNDSDGTFDPAAHSMTEKDGGKKNKAGWRERINFMDGRGQEAED